jgi:hypothetical protein
MSIVQSALEAALSVGKRCLEEGRMVGRGAEIDCEKKILMREVDRMLHSRTIGQLFSDHTTMGNSNTAR